LHVIFFGSNAAGERWALRRPAQVTRNLVLLVVLGAALGAQTPPTTSAPPAATKLTSVSSFEGLDSAVLEFRLTSEETPKAVVYRDGAMVTLRVPGILLAGRPEAGSSTGLFRRVELSEGTTPASGFTAEVEVPADVVLTHRTGPGRLWLVVCREAAVTGRGCPEAADIQQAAARRETERRRRAELEEERQRFQEDSAAAERSPPPAPSERPPSSAAVSTSERSSPAAEELGIAADRLGTLIASTAVRVGPGVNYESLADIPADTQVEITDAEAGWLAVRSDRAVGWVSGDLVRRSGAAEEPIVDVADPPPPPRRQPVPSPEVDGESRPPLVGNQGVTNSRVSLRTEPTVGSERIAVLSADRLVEVISEQGLWLQVKVGGVTGWIFSEYVNRNE
jgi:uncharacterized protein YraI